MDEVQLTTVIRRCKHLKYKKRGILAAYNFSIPLPDNFIIINSDTADIGGSHWLLLCNRSGEYLFAEPIGLPIHFNDHICKRLSYADFGIKEVIKEPLQKLSSNNCGLYCVYIAYYVFSSYFPQYLSFTESSCVSSNI